MKQFTSLLLAMLFAGMTFAQTTIDLQNDATELNIKSATSATLQVENKIKELDLKSQTGELGDFTQIELKSYQKNLSGTPGTPNLPVHSRMIEIPHGAEIVVTVVDYDEQVYDLDDFGMDKIAPLQPSYAKNTDPEDIIYHYDTTLYSSDQWIDPEIVTASLNGVMRGVNTGQITINPFRYNPGTNELAVLNNIKIDISFEGGNQSITENKKQQYYSPQFSPAYSMLLNYQEPANKDSFTSYPIKYVIVADRQFETTLQPFIEWKTKSGYNVVEAYTDDIGTTTTDIQNYLQGLYDAGTASDPAPTYVLIVGDQDGSYSVPAFDAETGDHVTDLYYACYDGSNDNIPDLYMGRMSANSTTELQNIMDKIIPYEKYTIPDGNFLNKAMLIAGVDGNYAPTHGDGTISYGIREYFNTAHGFSDIYAYYHTYTSGDYHVMSSTSGAAAGDIISKISDGVGFANYTAHCNWNGWGDPSVTNSDIASFNNQDEYAFMIGNCCLSYKFDESDAFGEEVLQTANKGAINYIGTSNNSYWDEDVHWGIGLTSLEINETNVPNHDYSNTGQGGYDGIWHEHGESFDQWFFTGGQMVYCSNLQVEASSTSRKKYYWEIYHNSGDPSLMPYMTEPDPLSINYTDPYVGSTTLTVTTEPYTYVAISQNGELLDAKWSGSGTTVDLSFASLTSDPASIVGTKQNRAPDINDFTPISPNPPVADFSGTPTTLLEGDSVTFSDLSDYAAEYNWDFGDGNTSTEANPVHTYMTAGTYTVSLEVTNALGNDTETKVDYITVNPNTNPPVADFEADVTTVTTGGTVNFTDLSTNLPDSWEWNFEGGTPATSTDQNPSVTYDAAGTYTVELTASNSYGSDTETKVDYITVELPSYCDAGSNSTAYEYLSNVVLGTIDNDSDQTSYSDFTAMTTDAAPGDELAFTATISNPYSSDHVLVWADWNRDGDFTDTGESVYTSADGEGPHSTTITVPAGTTPGPVRVRVRLEDNGSGPVNDPCGNSDFGEVEDYTINVISPDVPPVASFTASPLSTCDGIVDFTDESSYAESWAWDFGDGNTSTQQNPTHTYTADGTYTAELTVSNAYGTDTHTETNYITVDMPDAPVTTDATSCGPADLTLSASGSGSLNWYDAETGGNLISSGTSYTNYFDVTTTYYVESEIPGTTYSVGKLDNTGDGGYFGNVNYVHGLIFDAYTDFTLNSVKVYADGAKDRVINLKNESGTVIETRTVAVPDGESRIDLNIDVPAGVNYTIECDGDADLYRNSNGSTYPYEVADVVNIHYNTADNTAYYYYFYDWEISEGSCVSARTPVTATVNTIPTVDLGADQSICETDDATFDAGAGFSNYAWSNASSNQSITVNTADVYSVTVTDANGCDAEDTVELLVDAMPTIAIDAVGDLCETDAALTLNATPAGGTWSGTGVTGDQFDPGTGAGDYTITYEATNGECNTSDNISIHVDAMPDATIDPVSSLCLSDAAITLTAATAGGTWSGTGVSGDQFDPATAGIGTHTVTYEVTNGACTETDNITIDVTDVADASIDAVADMCESDGSITLTAATAGGTWSGTGITDA
ncbi:MAG: C25 family cysteine peptidase, partial [Bacteroidales bacterium]